MNGQNVFRPAYRELNQEEKEKIEAIKIAAQVLYDMYGEWFTRENSLAKTHLEESVMWAVKGLTSPQAQGQGLGVAAGMPQAPKISA